MAVTVRYLTHPQVVIDPAQDVRRWSLNATGHARVTALATSLAANLGAGLGALAATRRVISSDETKATQTAAPLARALGLTSEIRPRMHENDRSATGFLPPAEFEAVADAFFAHPTTSIRGWETAQAAQSRILSEVDSCLAAPPSGDILFVGHGGVGTLLFCALADLPIDRTHDQGPGGGGCWFAFDLESRKPARGWQPMETLMHSG